MDCGRFIYCTVVHPSEVSETNRNWHKPSTCIFTCYTINTADSRCMHTDIVIYNNSTNYIPAIYVKLNFMVNDITLSTLVHSSSKNRHDRCGRQIYLPFIYKSKHNVQFSNFIKIVAQSTSPPPPSPTILLHRCQFNNMTGQFNM